MSLTALCYNWGFFTVLGYAAFPMDLSAIDLGLVFFGWGLMVAIFAVFAAPRLQARFGIARTMYVNLLLFALCVLAIAIWVDHRPILIAAVIVSGIFCGVNNTITTQAVMTVSPVEKPVASAAYGFVRFIGGGLAPYVAGRLVADLNIHVPFYIAAGVVLAGIGVLSTAHKLLAEAEGAQAESVPVASASASSSAPSDGAPAARPGVIVAAIDDSPISDRVTRAAARLAGIDGRTVHVVHAQESAVTTETAVDGESPEGAGALVAAHLRKLASLGVSAAGQVLLHTADHGDAGRLVAEYANSVGATTIVVGAPTHGGLTALMDDSASHELWRHARSNLVIVNPAAPQITPAPSVSPEKVSAA
jgi:nucleotide-binding universal stress UspA family protein